ncbi:MAG: VOC family protein [Heyndrickxia sp.]
MNQSLIRVGTTYIPVNNVEVAAEWYVEKLGAEQSYKDSDKAIINLANQSFFLIRSKQGQSANFIDAGGNIRFSLTFEVDGLQALEELQSDFKEKNIKVGEIENRGHAGRNFVFYDLDGNIFDVWSELSPSFKKHVLQKHV